MGIFIGDQAITMAYLGDLPIATNKTFLSEGLITGSSIYFNTALPESYPGTGNYIYSADGNNITGSNPSGPTLDSFWDSNGYFLFDQDDAYQITANIDTPKFVDMFSTSGSFTWDYWATIDSTNPLAGFDNVGIVVIPSLVGIVDYWGSLISRGSSIGGITTYTTDGTYSAGSIGVTTGQWFNIQIVRDITNVKVYSNGVQIGSFTDGGNWFSTNPAYRTLTIGEGNTSLYAYPHDGKWGSLLGYDRALTENELLQNRIYLSQFFN